MQVKLDVQYGAKCCAPIWVLGDRGERDKGRESMIVGSGGGGGSGETLEREAKRRQGKIYRFFTVETTGQRPQEVHEQFA